MQTRQKTKNFLLSAFMFACGGVAHADTLDQSNVLTASTVQFGYALVGPASFLQSLAQTFTVGTSGQLSRVGVQIGRSSASVGDVTFELLSTTAGIPNPNTVTPLFQTVIPLSTIPLTDFVGLPITFVDVSSAHIAVTPGQTYAIAMRSPLGNQTAQTLWFSGGNLYSRGSEFIQQSGDTPGWRALTNSSGLPQDAGFQVYVNAVPELPTTQLMLLGALALCIFAPRSRRSKNE